MPKKTKLELTWIAKEERPRLEPRILLEDLDEALKWVKPGPGVVRIEYASGSGYHPDFVVETATEKLLCESKRRDEMDDPEVKEKARTAAVWYRYATEHELRHGGKPWRYLLIPHDEISANATLQGLIASRTITA